MDFLTIYCIMISHIINENYSQQFRLKWYIDYRSSEFYVMIANQSSHINLLMELQSKIQKLIDQMKENVTKATGRRSESIDYQLLNELRKTHRELYRSIEGNRRTN